MTILQSVKALFARRDRKGTWVYLVWLTAYGMLAFVAMAHASALGQGEAIELFGFLVPALVACFQYRMPTIFGWLTLFLPTALFGCVALVLAPLRLLSALAAGDFLHAGQIAGYVGVLGVVLWGFIRHGPFWNNRAGATIESPSASKP
jgi:hypothetical protein